jgi:mannose-6-phosphate isomerase-like protein (cupin superfamily)
MGVKLYEIGLDPNGRSISALIDVPMKKVGPKEAISAKQPGVLWRIGYRNNNMEDRGERNFSTQGPYELHLGGPPHFLGILAGYAECTAQDGSAWRMSPGDFISVRPGALHHADNTGNVRVIIMNVELPGTDSDTQPLAIK